MTDWGAETAGWVEPEDDAVMQRAVAHALSRRSIEPTYDHRQTGDRFTVETRVGDRRVSLEPSRDPFVHTRVTVGLRDLLRGLLRRRLGGDADIVEDVSELDADYAGRHGRSPSSSSTRRAEWKEQLEGALRSFRG